jgi:hypothetical protein
LPSTGEAAGKQLKVGALILPLLIDQDTCVRF